ncbi:MAG TPA: ATP-binding protein [Steroidobacteraceae bacterium]
MRDTETGGVLVGARRRGGRVELQVYDTGPGIPASLIPQLFVAYRRFSDTRNAARGHGLGLALVSKQAQLQRHEVTVRSLPGRGSLFGVSMPCGDGAMRRASVAVVHDRGFQVGQILPPARRLEWFSAFRDIDTITVHPIATLSRADADAMFFRPESMSAERTEC